MHPTILRLVGDITEGDLRYVDSYVGRNLALFIPSVGHCGYALRQGHTHPAFSFALYPDYRQNNIIETDLLPGPDQYLGLAISPDIPHQEPEGEAFVSYLAIFVDTELLARLELPLPYCAEWRPFLISTDILPPLQAFMAETQKSLPGRDVLLDALETAIATLLLRCLSRPEPEAPGVELLSVGVQRAVDLIHRHYMDKLTVAGLAGAAGMSQGSFARAFRRETGLPPMQYVMEIRLEKVRKLLADGGATVTEAALLCGFSSAAHLSGCFKARYHMTPSQFRQGRNV